MEQRISERYMEEYKDSLLEKFKSKKLLSGDLHYAGSKFKSYLSDIQQLLKMGDIITPSEEEIEKARIELADRDVLAYINLSGREVRPKKTIYDVWKEFRKETPGDFDKFVEICNPTNGGRRPFFAEYLMREHYSLLIKVYTMLRVKGLSFLDLIA